jgi:hypothetical protein
LMWYGYIYYIIFNLFLVISIIFFLRIYIINYLNSWILFILINKIFVSFVIFFFFISFSILHFLLDYYHEIILIPFLPFNCNYSYLTLANHGINKFVSITPLSLDLTQVYYYPFVYVFMLITILSILFCLSYNKDELMSFMFYCQLILASGYTIFFTDSIILFFWLMKCYLYHHFLFYTNLLKQEDVLKLHI